MSSFFSVPESCWAPEGKKTFLCANSTLLSSLNVYISGLWCSSWQIETFLGFFASITGYSAEGKGRSAKSSRQTCFLSPTKGINIWNPLRTQDKIDHNWGHFKHKMEHSKAQPAMMKSSVTLAVPLCPLHLLPSPSPPCFKQQLSIYLTVCQHILARIYGILFLKAWHRKPYHNQCSPFDIPLDFISCLRWAYWVLCQ